ncbi:SH3 domain-containing protein [Macrococcus brunensis]|uniref:SH3 domain-containing protein n=1 Tax=Macrococcus brunensis TaxID=198483 RepID=UPI001EF08A3F|nr:SH3 domain-containing protein [Macrococcus brunensis]ULG70891.1 SH3 domain-containing protein [Macrococcus brunensis]
MAKNAKMKYKFKSQLIPGLPRYKYETANGKPSAVGVHWVGNYKSYKSGEISYMSNNWQNAFVHAFADHTGVTEVANTDFLCWGIGPKGNGWMAQIEMVHSDTKEEFFKCLDHYIFWIAYQHYYYDMSRTVDNAENDGWGTLWTHNAVSKHLGGTDHVDPMDYISQWGVTLNQIVDKAQEYLTALYAGDSTHVAAIGEGTIIKTVDKVVETPKTTAPSIKKKPPVQEKVSKSLVPKTYIIKKNDTLYSIAKKYDLDVEQLKRYNKSVDVKDLKIGQEIALQSTSKPVSTAWKTHSKGFKYKREKASFVCTSDIGITTYYSGPALNNKKAGVLKKGEVVKYDTVYINDGHVWIKWTATDGKNVYMPIRTHKNGVDGPAWGTIK